MSWKEKDKNHYFNQYSSSKWIELDENNKITASFKFVKKTEPNQVIIYAEDRNFYIALSEQDAKFGNNQNDISNKFLDGSWVDKIELPTIWKENGKNHYFRKDSDTEWIEIDNGKTNFRFNFIEAKIEDNQIILYSVDRNFYINLNTNNAKWGDDKNNIQNVFLEGTWQLF